MHYYLNKRCTADEAFLQFSLPRVSPTQLPVMFQLCPFPRDSTGGRPDSLICNGQKNPEQPCTFTILEVWLPAVKPLQQG